jgi:nucleoside phosphorylase
MESMRSDHVHGLIEPADILLVTVTSVEARAVLDIAREKVGEPETIYDSDQVYYDLGHIGGAQTYMIRSEMGSGGPGGSTLTVSEAIDKLSPSIVIMVGIAFGVDRDKQQIGDILVSKQICEYELQRVSTNVDGSLSIIPRGSRVQASSSLLSRFRDAELWWCRSKVRLGLLFSGDKLIDNIDFRDQLRSLEPEAIGGEMEGVGLYSAAARKKVDWILVKGICDWADGKKYDDKHQNQHTAAYNAAELTLTVIERGGFTSCLIDEKSKDSKGIGEKLEKAPQDSYEQWFVLIHDQLSPADITSVLDALKPDLPYGDPVLLRPTMETWQQAVDYQREVVGELLLKSRQSLCSRFAIFSVAPIPLIVHLGFMLADTRTRCFKLHIDTKSWTWPTVITERVDHNIHLQGLPETTVMEACEVLIRVSLSARIKKWETAEVVPDLPVQIDMFIDEPSRMWLRRPDQLDTLMDRFRSLLEIVQLRVPNCQKIHLFYAGPAPGAFVIGQLINPRMMPPIQLYEYNRNKSPRYEPAVILSS